MTDYARMNKAELIGMLKALEVNLKLRSEPDQLQRVVNDLQVHQVEIEIQNHDLREAQQQLEQSREVYADLYDFSPIGYVTLDEKNIIRGINLTAVSMLGLDRAAHIGVAFTMYVEKNDVKKFRDHLRLCREAEKPTTTEVRLVARGNAAPMTVELHSLPSQDTARAGVGYHIAIANISQRKQAQDELALAKMTFEHSKEAIVICDNRNYIISTNKAFREITGYTHGEVVGSSVKMLGTQPDNVESHEAWWSGVVASGQWRGEVLGRRKGGASYPQALSITAVTNDHGYTSHYIYMFSDLERDSANKGTRTLLQQGMLGDLSDPATLHDRLRLALSAAKRNRTGVAVLFLGIDRFGVVNESLGHVLGDQLLQSIASDLAHCLREEDTVSHYSGDEFVVVLPEIRDTRNVIQTAEKILQAVRQPRQVEGVKLEITLSIGISLSPQDGGDAKSLITHAKAAMQRAKAKGRNNFQFFTPGVGLGASQRLSLERDLKRALDQRELLLDYQPQVAATMNRIMGCEALLRWRHPERGVLPALKIIETAEECGLMDAIGEWTVRTVCAQIRRWQDAGITTVPVSINVTGAQVCRENFADMVHGILKQHEINPSFLAFELSQHSFMENSDGVAAALQQLKTIGVRIVLDNFGGDYSSLGQLRRLPINHLKIDRALIHELPNSKHERTLVRTIVDLGYNFGLTIIASGVETRAQVECLSMEGCQGMQGHYFGSPMTADEMSGLLKSGSIPTPK